MRHPGHERFSLAPILGRATAALRTASHFRLRIKRCVGLSLFALLFALAIVLPPGDRLMLTPSHQHAAEWSFDLISWEVGNFADKWLHRAYAWLPWTETSEADRQAQLSRYREMVVEIRAVRDELDRSISVVAGDRTIVESLEARLDDLLSERNAIRDGVEEYLESAISAQLIEQDLNVLGAFIWPPVDFRLDPPPSILVVSPRDRIYRDENHLIEPHIPVAEMERIEQEILVSEDMSAIVQRTGGLSTYPATVQPNRDLLGLLEVAVHEWLHNYLVFKPLGFNYWSSPDMVVLNETVADMAGREMGRLVYAAITGEEVETLIPPRDVESVPEPPEDQFDFFGFMRETRIRTDELLAAGMIVEAERYMDDRRVELQTHGIYIRKINQAYFAFAGSYGESGSSISPIASRLWELRQTTSSAGEFVDAVAGVSSIQEFNALVEGLATPDS